MRGGFHCGNHFGMQANHPLRKWRLDKGLTQEAAAVELELNEPTLSRYETGRRTPSLGQAAKLSEKTGIPITAFVQPQEAAE